MKQITPVLLNQSRCQLLTVAHSSLMMVAGAFAGTHIGSVAGMARRSVPPDGVRSGGGILADGYVVHPHYVGAARDAARDGGSGGPVAIGRRRLAGGDAKEAFARWAYQQRRTWGASQEGVQARQVADELEVLRVRLGEPDAWVGNDAPRWHPGRHCGLHAVVQLPRHGVDHIAVRGVAFGLHRPGVAAHVHHDVRHRLHRRHLGVHARVLAAPGDVVHQVRALRDRLRRHVAVEGVHGEYRLGQLPAQRPAGADQREEGHRSGCQGVGAPRSCISAN
mmetsp:Transcript_35557/g.89658  ORF Transcript_35557/g.89658 Transcript_35557/m.89658 type:complete len:278 (+) Transcript_35557:158-991(+)